MSEAAETLDGWYSLHLFYAVDWTTFRLIAEDDREAMITELKHLLKIKQLLENHIKVIMQFITLQVKSGPFTMVLRPEMKELNQIENEFNKLRIADYLIPTYSYVSVIELSNYLAGKSDEDPYENPHVKARLYPELPHSEYICFYPMDKRRNETYNWYMLPIEDRKTLMYNHGMIGRKYAGKIKQFITGSVGFDDYEWVLHYFQMMYFNSKIVYEMRFDETTARYGEFGSFYIGHILNIEDFKQFLVYKLK